MTQCPRSVLFPGRSQGQGMGHLLGSWDQGDQVASPALPLTHCNLGRRAPHPGLLVHSVPGRDIASPSERQGQRSVARRPQRRAGAPGGIRAARSSTREPGTPSWLSRPGRRPGEGLAGCGERGLEAGLSHLREQSGKSRPLACSRIRVSHGLRSPSPPRVTVALSGGAPSSGRGDGGKARGQQVLCSQGPGLGPISITGCLNDPG